MPQKEKWDPEMADFLAQKKRFILASDFDQTLSFNDSAVARPGIPQGPP